MDPNVYSPEEIARLRGKMVIKNVFGDEKTIVALGNHTLADGEEIDLLDPATPDHLRASTYPVAELMVSDTSTELGQAVAAGWIEVIATPPDMSALRTPMG